ncbi:hydroxyisourate hydrolase [Friedmanniella luteola]|uniref:hydroxyisourate hydrolase n=1 Tax=Friedmanniella luteola TaxID=546871 RepID=UPI000B821318|nr:hydroxyisourate hydrolase [Friedmanniella luteola]
MTTHVLDAVAGRPASGIGVALEVAARTGWRPVAEGRTDDDGRVGDLGPADLEPGTYRVRFATGPWFAAAGVAAFYPEVVIPFTLADAAAHYHVPLLLSPFAFSTYRGS